MTDREAIAELPAIKFLKETVPDIVSGAKTLEARCRSQSWVSKIQKTERTRFTFGPRMGAPTTFAIAHINSVEIRGFDTATRVDVDRIGAEWVERPIDEFVTGYTDWYAKELAKGYPVAWIAFTVEETW